jgi:ABC-2 type transport system permease protein
MNSNYANFMVLGLVVTAIQLLTVLLAARAGSREYEDSTVGELSSLGAGVWSVVIGKSIVYLAIMLPIAILALYLPGMILGVPMMGSDRLLIGFTAWFVSIWVLAAMGVSALIKDSLMTLEAFVVIVMPSYLLSGNTWPTFAMPHGVQLVSFALPLSHYVAMVRRTTMMGATLDCFRNEIIVLGVWSAVSLLLAYLGMRQLIKTGAKGEGVRS